MYLALYKSSAQIFVERFRYSKISESNIPKPNLLSILCSFFMDGKFHVMGCILEPGSRSGQSDLVDL